jgi:hypothetical protein
MNSVVHALDENFNNVGVAVVGSDWEKRKATLSQDKYKLEQSTEC